MSATSGNGMALTQGWDQDYHLLAINAAAGANVIQNLAYTPDADGNIQTITDNLNGARNQSFTYDDLNRLWSASGLYGSESWLYDGVGNRTSATANGTVSTYTPSTTSNQIVSITTGGYTRPFSYYPTGQVQSDQRNATMDYGFTYNGSARLSNVSLNNNALSVYAYNGLEQRVQKTTSATTTDFVYDTVGHLIAEANDATGAMIREYIWMDDKPIAMVDWTSGNPVVYDIHTDHLNRPQKLTDQNANLVWDGVFDPFGNVAFINSAVVMPLMFPGQYYDSETQLSQNWNRDYDPTIGRYIQSDPIGLLGGSNTYEYTMSNPLILDDPSGTQVALPMPPPPVGVPNSGQYGSGSVSGYPPYQSTPMAAWAGDKGAEEWGRRVGIDPDVARRRFHKIKQDCKGKGKDDYKVDPTSGDVYDPEGEVVGNLGD